MPDDEKEPFFHFSDGSTEDDLEDDSLKNMASAIEESMRSFGVKGILFEDEIDEERA